MLKNSRPGYMDRAKVMGRRYKFPGLAGIQFTNVPSIIPYMSPIDSNLAGPFVLNTTNNLDWWLLKTKDKEGANCPPFFTLAIVPCCRRW